MSQLSNSVSKFSRGDRVRKVSGAEWSGHVVGEYSTALTPEGYAVESDKHPGSVQIYPAKALEAVGAGVGPFEKVIAQWDEARKKTQQPSELETRADGKQVRVDRWEVAIRRIVALLWGNRREFEVDDVVDAVRTLAGAANADDEVLVRAVIGERGGNGVCDAKF